MYENRSGRPVIYFLKWFCSIYNTVIFEIFHTDNNIWGERKNIKVNQQHCMYHIYARRFNSNIQRTTTRGLYWFVDKIDCLRVE